MLEMNEMLKIVVEAEASDLHCSVGKTPVMRVHGTLEVVDPAILTADDTERLMKEITPPRYQQQIQEQGSADFAYAYSDLARFRTNVYRSMGRLGIVMRLIPTRKLSFQELGLPKEHILDLLHAERGLCVITGPTGSGKSTTLATMIDYINTERYAHIITIEDPVEYTHVHKKAIITHRELHVDTPSFAAALRTSSESSPRAPSNADWPASDRTSFFATQSRRFGDRDRSALTYHQNTCGPPSRPNAPAPSTILRTSEAQY